MSEPPTSRVMNPNPRSELNVFTVPVCIDCTRRALASCIGEVALCSKEIDYYRTGLYLSPSPFPGNGILEPEARRKNGASRNTAAFSETSRSHMTAPFGGISQDFQETPQLRDCVVERGGFELRARHAVISNGSHASQAGKTRTCCQIIMCSG